MLYSEIETYFKSKENTDELLSLYEAIFIDIDEIDERLKNGEVETIEEIDTLIGKLSGLANKCEMVAEISDTQKKSQEGILEYAKLQQCEKDKKKPVMTQISSQVSHEVQFVRRVRDYFRAYTKRADRALGGCQSRLKKKEKIRSSEGNE